ncbi:unnamed protein product [Spirodela intermedia]|uniref:Uncharacterized protein n=1 Tax=Spirodela intermedia TaxID=51605 RepID=A0A7I8J2X4_SPIIN|nr:unnamed protein product [Spirodela intermedia]CAA6664556.1 unnamed protein product [Spirodela intermedia]
MAAAANSLASQSTLLSQPSRLAPRRSSPRYLASPPPQRPPLCQLHPVSHPDLRLSRGPLKDKPHSPICGSRFWRWGDRRGRGAEGHGRGGGNGDWNEGSGSSEDGERKKMGGGMSMSQKITLGYAALVGVGGLMGYLKSGSQKSLGAGGASALLLYFVYTQLPVRPAFASSLGLGLSAALLVVMGSRFRKSGKIFPAGVVSLFSLVMVCGYAHGIMRGLHA